MKKIIALLMVLFCVFGFTGCNKDTESLGIMVDGVFYEKAYAMPAEIDESAIMGYVESYTDTIPKIDGETNISKDLLGAPYAKVEGGIALLYENEWYLCKTEPGDEGNNELPGREPTEHEEPEI